MNDLFVDDIRRWSIDDIKEISLSDVFPYTENENFDKLRLN